MTARLPNPGADGGVWGEILNEFLRVEHNQDGTLKIRGDGVYQKPASGIPTADLDIAAQAALTQAGGAYQKPSGGIPKTDLSSSVQSSLSHADAIDTTALQTGIDAKVTKTGDTMTGDLTLDGTSAARQLNLTSSFAGNDNDSDSTSRINLYSYQRAQLNNTSGHYAEYGEVIRIFSRKEASKQMIAWYGPTAYDATSHDPTTADTTWFWMGAHYEANDYASVHGHWSIETPDAAAQMQTRFEFRIWDPTTGTFGMNRTIAKFNAADVIVEQSNGAFWLAAAAGLAKNLYFTNDTTVVNGGAGKRWGLQADTTTETGSNVGTNFRINRYSDAGAFVDSPIQISRSNGQVTVTVTPAATDSSTKVADTAFVAAALPGLAANAPLSTASQGYVFGPDISPWVTGSVAALAGNATTNVLKLTQFTATKTITITKMTVNVTTSAASSSGNVAIYNAAGASKLLDVNFSTAAMGNVTVTGLNFTFQAGNVYWLATSSASTTVAIEGVGMSAAIATLIGGSTSGATPRCGYSSTTLSGTTMPGSIGTVTTSNFSIGCPFFEP